MCSFLFFFDLGSMTRFSPDIYVFLRSKIRGSNEFSIFSSIYIEVGECIHFLLCKCFKRVNRFIEIYEELERDLHEYMMMSNEGGSAQRRSFFPSLPSFLAPFSRSPLPFPLPKRTIFFSFSSLFRQAVSGSQGTFRKVTTATVFRRACN